MEREKKIPQLEEDLYSSYGKDQIENVLGEIADQLTLAGEKYLGSEASIVGWHNFESRNPVVLPNGQKGKMNERFMVLRLSNPEETSLEATVILSRSSVNGDRAKTTYPGEIILNLIRNRGSRPLTAGTIRQTREEIRQNLNSCLSRLFNPL
jgi:hypothetical protein